MTKLVKWAARTLYNAADGIREFALDSIGRSGQITEMDMLALKVAQWLDRLGAVAEKATRKGDPE